MKKINKYEKYEHCYQGQKNGIDMFTFTRRVAAGVYVPCFECDSGATLKIHWFSRFWHYTYKMEEWAKSILGYIFRKSSTFM